MNRFLLPLVVVVLCCNVLPAIAQERFVVMEYNVENLFDCRHDSLKKDTEFLPGSIRGWNSFRFREKLKRLSKVIYAAGSGDVPDLVALCEVENRYCLTSLVKYSPLREAGYRFIMTDSPDERGIDVALLYQPFKFKVRSSESIRIQYSEATRPTRDILHVTGITAAGNILDVFVCHMPSRSGGKKVSEPYRLFTAGVLRHKVDSVLNLRENPNIIVMGDFNDYPEDSALVEVLQARRPGTVIDDRCLYNLMDGKRRGTYKYKNEWGILDHMIVNGRMLQKDNALCTTYEQVSVLDFPFLLAEDEKYGGVKPFRTYNGMRYNEGYSDHLPIRMIMELK